MPPTPTPQSAEIDLVQTIAELPSYDDAVVRIDAFVDAQWVATLDDIDLWTEIRDKYVEIKGGLLGANKSPEQQRLDITNRIRVRFGLPRLLKSGIEVTNVVAGTTSVEVTHDGGL